MADTSLIFNLLARDKTGAGLKSAQGGFAKFSKAATIAAAGVGAAMVKIGKDAINAASDYTEASNKVDAVFKDQAGIVRQFESQSTKSFGISKKAALDYTSAMGSVLTASGVNRAEAAKLSVQYTKLAADLGSFNNTSTEEAAEALKAALTGEVEQMKKYGVVLNDTILKSEAISSGLVKNVKDVDKIKAATIKHTLAQRAYNTALKEHGKGSEEALRAEAALATSEASLKKAMAGKVGQLDAATKRQAIQNVIMKATADAQGDVARNTNTAAFKQRQLQARVDDLQVSLGQKLLPTYIKLLGVGQKILSWTENHSTATKRLVIAAVSLTGAILAVNGAIKVYKATTAAINAVQKAFLAIQKSQRLATLALQVQYYAIRAATLAWSAAQWILNAAMMAAPYILIAAAIVGIIAVVVLIATKTDWFQKLWSVAWGAIKGSTVAVFQWIKSHWPLLLAILTGPIGLAVLAITKNWGRIKSGASSVVSWVRDKFGDLVGFVSGLPGRISRAARGMFDGIKSAFRSAINWIIGGWNSLRFGIPSINTHLPGIGTIGGGSFGVPQIPYLAKGGVIERDGMAVVGERGPELLSLSRGAQVTPLSKTGGAQRVEVVLRVEGGDEELVRMIRKWVRAQTGGNVQAALGR